VSCEQLPVWPAVGSGRLIARLGLEPAVSRQDRIPPAALR
jgi:hypothetical protein